MRRRHDKSRPVSDEAFRVAQHLLREPVASRPGADEHEQRVRLFDFVVPDACEWSGDPFDVTIAFDPLDVGAAAQPDVRGRR